MGIQYDLSAAELLQILGYSQPVGRDFLEELKQEKQIPLPSTYAEFMESAWKYPIFSTSNLRTSKVKPWMYYDEIQEYVDDLKAHQETVSSRNRCCPFMHTPREEWPSLTGDYLFIGSDFCGGEITFGLRKGTWTRATRPCTGATSGIPSLSGGRANRACPAFCLRCSGMCWVEQIMAPQSRRWSWPAGGPRSINPQKDDWVASKAVLKRHGILYSSLKRYKCDEGGKVFGCYVKDLNAIFAGILSDGEIDLYAINQMKTEKILLDIDDYNEPEDKT